MARTRPRFLYFFGFLFCILFILYAYSMKSDIPLKDKSTFTHGRGDEKVSLDISKIVPKELPVGWQVQETVGNEMDNSSLNIFRLVSNESHIIKIQVTGKDDYLRGGGYPASSYVLESFASKKGNQLYVIRSSDYVYLSSCEIKDGVACSPEVDGQKILILMHAYQNFDQYARELSFNTKDTQQSILDFIQYTKSLEI